MTTLDIRWFGGEMGIVKARDETTKEVKYYIGACEQGGTEESDTQHILALGTKLNKEARKELCTWLSQD